jgi:hypothetical protein
MQIKKPNYRSIFKLWRQIIILKINKLYEYKKIEKDKTKM